MHRRHPPTKQPARKSESPRPLIRPDNRGRRIVHDATGRYPALPEQASLFQNNESSPTFPRRSHCVF